MKNNAVTNKIKLLKRIKPNPDWLESQRRNLLLHIESDNKAHKAWSLPGFSFAFKPVRVMVIVLLLGLIFGSGFLTVQAAKGSLPGDLLYPVKIAMEKVRVKISSPENRTKLQAEFVGTRAEELSQIIEEPGDIIEKKEKVFEVADKLQEQVISAKTELNKIKESKPEKVVEVAEKISQKTAQSQKTLEMAKEKLVKGSGDKKSQEVVKVIDETMAIISAVEKEIKKVKGGMKVSNMGKPAEVKEPIITVPNQTVPIPLNEASTSEASTSLDN